MLQAGEVRSHVDIALARSVAISGRVVDEWGQPVAGVSVGRKHTVPRSGDVPGRVTDDRGIFRVFGLEPGRYSVCTDPGPGLRQQLLGLPARSRSVPTCYPSATVNGTRGASRSGGPMSMEWKSRWSAQDVKDVGHVVGAQELRSREPSST